MGRTCCERLEDLRREMMTHQGEDPTVLLEKSAQVLEWANQVLVYQFQRTTYIEDQEERRIFNELVTEVENLSVSVNSFARSGFPAKLGNIINSIQSFIILARNSSFDQGSSEVITAD